MEINKASLETFIKTYVGRVLDEKPENIDVDREVDQYGLSSILVVSLIGELEGLLGLELSPALIFEYPTICEISGRLEELYLESREPRRTSA